MDSRPRIGIFGRRNRGKSTLFNALLGQQRAVVSPEAGTTTDPVRKAMEILGRGAVVLIDTAGIDDDSSLGQQRISKTQQELGEVDLALILFKGDDFSVFEEELIERCLKRQVPFLLVNTMTDRYAPDEALIDRLSKRYDKTVVAYSSSDDMANTRLLDAIGDALLLTDSRGLLDGLVAEGDVVILVCPIDSEAPDGRLILPQVQVLRALLDSHARALVCRESELQDTLALLPSTPRMVITDSQVFKMVADIVPDSVPLTSFSILLARAKGPFDYYLRSTAAIDNLSADSKVLLIESCTHNSSCEDIGRVKLPRMLRRHVGAEIYCETVVGASQPRYPVEDYDLVIQCGGCVATARQIYAHVAAAIEAHRPVTNYGLAISYLTHIFHRATQIFNHD